MTFWRELVRKKLDVMRLDDAPVPVQGSLVPRGTSMTFRVGENACARSHRFPRDRAAVKLLKLKLITCTLIGFACNGKSATGP